MEEYWFCHKKVKVVAQFISLTVHMCLLSFSDLISGISDMSKTLIKAGMKKFTVMKIEKLR